MLRWLRGWSRARKAISSTVVIAVAAGIPLTVAALYHGFPVSDVDLTQRDVWVTNAQQELAGRLNRQIDELDASVQATTASMDVVQSGRDVFLINRTAHTLERIDPAYTTLGQRADLPKNAEVGLGGSTLAIVDPSNGALWSVDVSNQLSFDPTTRHPAIKLGAGGHATVTPTGVVIATSPKNHQIVTVARPGARPTVAGVDIPADNQISSVGEKAVVLEPAAKKLLVVGGPTIDLPAPGLKLQQASAAHDYAVVAGRDELMEVPLGGGTVTRVMAGIPDSASGNGAIAPVWVDGCAHGAWASSQRYLLACDGRQPQKATIHQETSGDELAFRVNGHVVALNNVDTGNVWVMADSLHLVDNWDEVTPPKEQQNDQIDKTKSSVESFEDTLAKRTSVNHPPTATPDTFGVRAGRTTVLPVLDNDTDPDGDVLVISDFTGIPASLGRLDPIDGGRALQFTPATDAAGSASFRYTVSDGRENGTDSTTVDVHVVPPEQNSAPVSHRKAAVSVENGQSISYNVLRDFLDPDGDDVFLQSASPSSGDQVRFTPDGTLTFQSTGGQTGLKTVHFQVSDGRAAAVGELTVDVKPAGSLDPIGTPDYGQGFVGDTVQIDPLQNDVSPSGQPLQLLGVKDVPGDATATPKLDAGTISVSSQHEGAVYFQYALGAGASTSVGIVRVDFRPRPEKAIPPVAVTDTAYLRQGQSTEVRVLDNDVSPAGNVLAIQSIDTSALDPEVKVEVLNNTVVRISTSAAITKQTQFTYRISDGVATAVAGVTVVPVPPVVDRQPPVAVDDHATVRAGDIATVHVLANDYHPDQEQLILQHDLVDDRDAGGIAFTSGQVLRYQAPTKPGVYSVIYRVADQFGESATAAVTITVTARDVKGDRPPAPDPQTARTFAGSKVRIDVPLDGIDPDGDSVTLVGYTTAPELGRIVESTSDHFVYEAYPKSAGTDTFRYAVEDTLGKTAIGEVRVGVIPRAAESRPPDAVDDTVSVRPGKTISVQPLLNDSDPNGYPLRLAKKLTEVDKHLVARTEGSRVLITAPKTEGAYNVGYRVENGQGGTDDAFVIVRVDKKAPIQPPTAQDFYISPDDLVDKSTFTVNVGKLIYNPNGEDSALKVSTVGPNAGLGDVSGQRVTVHAQSERIAVAYQVSDPVNPKLASEAFIIVPPKAGSAYSPPPYLRPDLPRQVIPQNGEKEWDLKDILVVPSGRPAIITDRRLVNANGSDGTSLVVDKNTIRFAAQKGFRGETAITFEVTDGDSAIDRTGRKALITMPLTVGNPDMSDVAPTFSTMTLQIEAGEAPRTVDLRESTGHPNRSVINRFRYDGLTGSTDYISGSLSGATLSVSSPLGTRVGTTTDLHFQIHYRDFTVPGTVHVVTVPSTRPRAQAITDEVKGQRSVTQTVDVLKNDYNPFADQGKPLTLTAATVDNAAETSARVSFTSDGRVTVSPDASFIGVVSIAYTVRDATKDPSRDVTGRLLVTVRDRPDQITPAPAIVKELDQAVTISWTTPATNGEPILDYTITWTGGGSKTVSADTARYTITGLHNGDSYRFAVSARNMLGDATVSQQSAVAIPFGTPTPPTTVSATPSRDGSGNITLTWGGAQGNGRDITGYTWTLSNGTKGTTTGAQTATAKAPVGSSYTYTVTATNGGGLTSAPSKASSQVIPLPGPPKNATLTKGADGDRTIKMTWGAATSYGPTPTYQVSINNGGWATHSSGDTFEGSFGTSYQIKVRAVVNGHAGDADTSNSVTPQKVQPPATSGSVYKGGAAPYCSGCHYVGLAYSNFASGTYRVVTLIDGSAGDFYVGTYSLSGSGRLTLQNGLGQRNNDNIQVRVTNANTGATYYTTPAFRGWDSLPVS